MLVYNLTSLLMKQYYFLNYSNLFFMKFIISFDLTKELSSNAIRICDSLDNVILVSVGSNDNETKIRIGGVETTHNERWWSLSEFINGVLV